MPRIQEESLQAHRATVRQKLVRAAGRLFASRNYEAVTLADVAKEAGVTRTTVYNYFQDKAHLFMALCNMATEEFISRLGRRVAGEKDPIGRIRAIVEEELLFAASQDHRALLASRELRWGSIHTSEGVKNLENQVVEFLASAIREGDRSGIFRAPEPELAAKLVQGTILAAGKDVALMSSSDEEAARELARSLVGRVLPYILSLLGHERRE